MSRDPAAGSPPFQDYLHPQPIQVGVSNRHVHLSREHVETLFGDGARLTHLRDVTQKGQYACHETVAVATGGGVIHRMRVIGPERAASQVELSMTDARVLRIQPPIRGSGKLEGTAGCTLLGPKGTVVLEQGVLIPMRHIHMSPRDAERYGVGDQDIVKMVVASERGMCLDDVLIRVHPTFVLDFHLDTDEANAALVRTGDSAYMVDEGKLGMDLGLRFARPARGRRLLTESELKRILDREGRIRIPPGVLLTPSARDLARRMKIE